MPAPSTPMSIEIVCTGNVCRSPYAAVRLQAALDEISPGHFRVTSSGTHALRHYRPENGTRRVLAQRGLDSSGLRSRQVTPAILESAVLVLVMDETQRLHVIDEWVGAAPRTFLIKEFARLVTTLEAEQPWAERLAGVAPEDPKTWWKAAIRMVHQARSRFPATPDDWVADPYKQKDPAFDTMADEIDRALAAITDLEADVRTARAGQRRAPQG